MKTSLGLLLLAGGTAMAQMTTPPELVTFRQAGLTIDSTFWLDGGALTKEMAKSFARRVGRRNLGQYQTLRVAIFSDEQDALGYQGRGEECRSMAECFVLVSKAKIPAGPIAEVLESRSGSALRYRSAIGEVSREVISGADPYVIRTGKSVWEIVHVGVSPYAPLLRNRPGGANRVEVYMHTEGKLSEAECGQAAAKAADLVGHNLVTVTCRADRWFWSSGRFPVRHPFLAAPVAPTERDATKSRSIICSVDQSKRYCITLP